MTTEELLKAFHESPEVDKKAVLGSIRANIRYVTDRKASYAKDHPDAQDPKIIEALDDREKTANLVLDLLQEPS
jgi:hypothetical protein